MPYPAPSAINVMPSSAGADGSAGQRPPAGLGAGQIMAAASHETVFYLLILQSASTALALLWVSPVLFRHITTGRYKTGWLMVRNKKETGLKPSFLSRNQTPADRSSTVPIGQKSSTLTVWRKRVYNSALLKTIPFIKLTVGQIMVLTVLFSFATFGMIYENLNTISSNFKRPGWVSIAFLPLLFCCAIKNTPFGILGKSYEKVNFIHRFIGRIVFLGGLAHGIIWWKGRLNSGGPIVLRGASFTGAIALGAMLIVALTSIPYFRAKFYQTFLLCHILGYVTILVTLWRHAPSLQPFIGFCVLALLIDNFITFFKTSVRSAVFTSLPGGLTRIEVDRLGDGWKAGQHVYLRVFKGVRAFEKHPFTIANAPAYLSPSGRNTLFIVAKATGDFTHSLHRVGYAEAALVGDDLEKRDSLAGEKNHEIGGAASESRLAVGIEGPYGNFYTDMTDFETVLLVAGGSGFTYCMSTFEHIVGSASRGIGVTKTIFIVWALRDLGMVQVFANALNNSISRLHQHQMQFIMRIYITSTLSYGDTNPVPHARVVPNRVKLSSVLNEALETTSYSIDTRGETRGCGLGVGVCGPMSLVASAREAVSNANSKQASKAGGITLHSEVFGW